jgi:hypothetical protein
MAREDGDSVQYCDKKPGWPLKFAASPVRYPALP